MTDNQFDHFVRGKLQDHSAPVPPGLWEKIDPGKKDDRKGFFLPRLNGLGFLVIAAALLVAVSMGSYLYVKRATPTSPSAKLPTDASNATIPTSGNPTNEISEENNSNRIDANNSQQPNQSNPTEPSENSNNAPLTSTGKTQQAISNQDNQVPIPVGIASRPEITSSKKSNGPSALALPHNQLLQFSTPTLEIQNHSVPTQSIEVEEKIDYPTGYQFSLGTPMLFSRKGYSLNSLKDMQLAAGRHTQKIKNIVICPTDQRGTGQWDFEVYVSPDMAFKSIENKTATAQYLQKKDSSERMQIGFTAGIRLVKPITDNMLLKAGLQYTQINEKFTYRTENEIKTTTVVTVRTIVRAPGDTVIVRDTSVVQQIGFTNNRINNRYRSIDIPVTIGYQTGNKDSDLRFGINAGVIINVSSWYQGVILDSSLAAVAVSKGTNQVYKNNVGLGLYAGFSVLKKINEDSHIFFEPYFRYNLSHMTSAQSSYNQKFSLGGLSIGLRYNLSRRY